MEILLNSELSFFFSVDLLSFSTFGLIHTQTVHRAGNCFGIMSISRLTAVHFGISDCRAQSLYRS